jgi:hypothetical protein
MPKVLGAAQTLKDKKTGSSGFLPDFVIQAGEPLIKMGRSVCNRAL